MSEYTKLSRRAELDLIDEDECVAGYRSGLINDPEPGSDKSKSFWHGWRNGMMDRGILPLDAEAQKLAREVVAMHRAH